MGHSSEESTPRSAPRHYGGKLSVATAGQGLPGQGTAKQDVIAIQAAGKKQQECQDGERG